MIWFILVLVLPGHRAFGQQVPEGRWVTVDDRTGERKSVIEFTLHDGLLYGTVVQLLQDSPDAVCTKCKDERKDRPVVGMTLVRDLRWEDGSWTDGYILDPGNGKEYRCTISIPDSNNLMVRGYLGLPAFGRTQNWEKQ